MVARLPSPPGEPRAGDDRRAAEGTATRAAFPDWRFAPNIGGHPDVYEIENRAVDPDGHVLAAMRKLAPWDGRTLVDLGCGTGFWLPGYATDAARVIGVEPDPALRAKAEARVRALSGLETVPGSANAARPGECEPAVPGCVPDPHSRSRRPGSVEVIPGSAEHLPLPDCSADVVHARFAYFLSPGIVGGQAARSRAADGRGQTLARAGGAAAWSGTGHAALSGTGHAAGNGTGYAAGAPGDAGLAEVMRVLRPGGSLIVVDNDYRWGEFADLLAEAASVPPRHTANTIDAWWRDRAATRHEVRSRWHFASRADLAAVLGIEVPAAVARAWLARHPAATGLTYGHVLFAVTRTVIPAQPEGPRLPPLPPSVPRPPARSTASPAPSLSPGGAAVPLGRPV